MTQRLRTLAVLAATTALAAACTGGGVDDPVFGSPAELVTVKVAFFQDGSVESPNIHGQPAFLGLKLALSQAIESETLPVLPELVGFDTKGDPSVAAELAREVAADPTYVAAVAAPFWLDTSDVAGVLGDAGIPVLSLAGSAHPEDGLWLPMVAGRAQMTEALAGYVRGLRGAGGVCSAGDGSEYARTVGERLEARLRGSLYATVSVTPTSGDASDAAATIVDSGCSTVVWTGFSTGAGELRAALADVPMVGTDAMSDPTFLEVAGPAAEDTVAVCPCVDLTTSTDPAAQRFVHDFQADYSTPPGGYAAEGWDAGGLLLRAFATGVTTREAVSAELSGAAPFEGLAATYSTGAAGPSARVHVSRVDGGRWVAVAPDRDGLPVRTDGVLAVGSCRVGPPYAYREPSGRLVGFDVELARAIAADLDLALGWTRTSCAAGTGPVDRGRVDVLLAPAAGLVPGTPASRVVSSTRAALVVPADEVTGGGHADPPAEGDVVGVAAGPPIRGWARRTLVPNGARLRLLHDPARAYDLLERGRLAAVADTEASAWAAIEHRSELLVGSTDDTGADDVMVTAASETDLLAAVDDALGRVLDDGSYALLFAKYFPGATLPGSVGS